ncbi:MAG: PilZ domain-containing protein [Polyangiaceae bacterium]
MLSLKHRHALRQKRSGARRLHHMQPRDLRVPAQFHITFHTVDALVVAYSSNLSRGGLFLKTTRLLPPESVMSLIIHLPDGGDDITVDCSVVFTRDGTDGQPQGMGLKFIDPDENVKKRIEWFIINSSPRSQRAGCAIADTPARFGHRRRRPLPIGRGSVGIQGSR